VCQFVDLQNKPKEVVLKHNLPNIILAALVLLLATGVVAGDLYMLEMRYEGPIPSYPAQIEIDVLEGGHCDHYKGTATADFDGVNVTNNVGDDVVSIDDITITGSTMAINYTVMGYDNHSNPPKFKASTCFAIDVNGNNDGLSFHTSCSQPVLLNYPYPGDSGGIFTVLDGDGDCLDDGTEPEECPDDHHLYWLAGNFQVPCSSPGNVTLTIYDSDHFNDPRGTATGYFDGSSLTNIVEDDVARLMGAYMDGGELVIVFEAFGFDHFPAHFKATTSFEIVVEGCGTYRLVRYHTSCSQPVTLFEPYSASPSGVVTFTNFCGCEENTISNEDTSWGAVKALYR